MNNQENWKDVKGYEGIYQVSDTGRIKSLKRYRVPKDLILKTPVNSHGYPNVGLNVDGNKKLHVVHTIEAIAFLDHVPCGFTLVIDHINFIKTDNRLCNLRIVSNRENTNQKHIKSSSKYTGVSWFKTTRKWRAGIKVGKKHCHLGYFNDELDASKAYEKALAQTKEF